MEYNYIKVPINLFYLMDANCTKVLITLVQMSDYYGKDGWFYRTMNNLEDATGLSQNVIRAALDTLYTEGLVDVDCTGVSKGKHPNHYKVNFEKFKEYEKYSLDEIVSGGVNKIETAKYKSGYFKPTYMHKQEQENQQKCQPKKVSTNITNIPNITNIENKDNIDNITNIDNKEIKELNNLSIDIPSIEHRDPNRPGLGQVYLDDDLIRGLSDIERSIQLEYYYTLRDIRKLEVQKLDFNDSYYLPQTLDWLEKRNIHQLEQYMLYWNDGGRAKLSQEMEGLTPAERKDIIIYLVLYCKADDTRCSENIYQPVYAA